MNLHATHLHESEPLGDAPAGSPNSPPPAATGRFAYATGSRPLAGYTIKRGIGHGGFGEVYYATSDAGKEVALKLIRRNWDVELRGVTQCLNLKHPNLLALFDVRQDDTGDNWVVMELMSGDSLEELLAKNPDGLPEQEALAWIHGIAAGVAYLHDHGIVHRDLKPGNIFVDEGIVKIGDYGLSKFISCSRRSGQTGSVGTVHYMAPEIANGRYGKEIDIYAVGIILYEMLTGHVPFEGESVGEILMKHLTAEPDLNRLAESYRTIVGRALAKDPGKRFSTMNELIALLPAVQAGTATANAARYIGPTRAATPADVAGAQGADPRFAGQPANADGFSYGNAAKQAAQQANQGEPIVQWIHETKNDFTSWWQRKNFKPWQKLLILLVGLFVAFHAMVAIGEVSPGRSGASFVNFVIIIAVIYWIYRRREGKRVAKAQSSNAVTSAPFVGLKEANLNRGVNSPVAAPVMAAAAVAPTPQNVVRDPMRESPTRRRWKRWSSTVAYQPAPPRERATQLVGSMLLSAVASAVITLVAIIVVRGDTPEPLQYAWATITSVLGAWSVLALAKCWEGQRGDPVLRRFAMLMVGLAFGVAGYGLMNWLVAPLNYESRFMIGPGRELHDRFFDGFDAPKMVAFLAYFGFLFFIVRWWKLADPVRGTRLSIWHTLCAVFFAWVVGLFWPFPQPWGWMLTATMAISIQLAAPWIAPADRAQLSQNTAGGV